MTEPTSLAANELPKPAPVGRTTAIIVFVLFCAVLVVPVAMEIPRGRSSSLRTAVANDVAQNGIFAAMPQIEEYFIYQSRFVSRVRKPYQTLLVSALRQGSRSVLLGHNHTLFHRNDILNVVGHGIDVSRSVNVLAGFRDQLATRGVPLLVVVVPGKVNVYPELLSARYDSSNGPPMNAAFVRWKSELRDRQVSILDLTPAFWERKSLETAPLFARYDTHWSPQGVAFGAELIADRVAMMLHRSPAVQSTLVASTRSEPRDLVHLLGLDDDAPLFPSRLVNLSVSSAPPSYDRSDAPVLLFGDSMTEYYEEQRGSLADLLTERLGLPVQRFAGAGRSLPTAIQAAFDSQPGILRNKRVVILEMQVGQLYAGTFSAPLRVH